MAKADEMFVSILWLSSLVDLGKQSCKHGPMLILKVIFKQELKIYLDNVHRILWDYQFGSTELQTPIQ